MRLAAGIVFVTLFLAAAAFETPSVEASVDRALLVLDDASVALPGHLDAGHVVAVDALDDERVVIVAHELRDLLTSSQVSP